MTATLMSRTSQIDPQLPWEEARHWHLLWIVCDRIGILRRLEERPQATVSMATALDVNVHMLARILQLLTQTGYVRDVGDGYFAMMHVPMLPRMLESWSSIEGPILNELADRMIAALHKGDVPLHRIYSANFVHYVCTRYE
jgi:DNA-binding transcriptional regulator YhcF (GntR family)